MFSGCASELSSHRAIGMSQGLHGGPRVDLQLKLHPLPKAEDRLTPWLFESEVGAVRESEWEVLRGLC